MAAKNCTRAVNAIAAPVSGLPGGRASGMAAFERAAELNIVLLCPGDPFSRQQAQQWLRRTMAEVLGAFSTGVSATVS